MEQKRILVVDDEKEITDLIEIYLTTEGYQVVKRYDALTIQEDIKDVDLVILDIMMPTVNGLQACQMVREKMNIPIIMLSAKSADADKIIGLNLGADDYMVKPFNPLELVARIKAQLRRYTTFNPQEQADDLINIRGLSIDQKKHLVSVNGQRVSLTPTEFDILVLLCSHPNIVFSMEEIFETVWKEKYFDSNNTVMVHIRKLREKIEKNPRYPEYIKTVWGVGYKVEQ